MRNLIISAALVAASLFGMAAQANAEESKAPYVELTNPVPVAVPGKIEVVELFWYGCPHCYAFEPVINPWVEKLPSDVNFMGVEHQVHAAVFNAIQKEGKKLTKKEDMAEFLATQGVDKDKFLATFDSFAIQGQIKKARELAKKYEITGVPTMIVNGKYRFDIGSAGGANEALQLADKLIAKERAATKAAAN
jgi:thiol:disulfide interchange protein DsbA